MMYSIDLRRHNMVPGDTIEVLTNDGTMYYTIESAPKCTCGKCDATNLLCTVCYDGIQFREGVATDDEEYKDKRNA
jgi:hypothetical protein